MELLMRQQDRERLKVLAKMAGNLLGTDQGAEQLGVGRRQAQRALAAYRRDGDKAAIHGLRGRSPNNAKAPGLRRQALDLVRERYGDFGPTLAAEALAERHAIAVTGETLRQWLIADGQWRGARAPRRHRRRRPRRACFGELVQMDTSSHAWLEERGPQLQLITMIDDATGYKLLRFAFSDGTETNMEAIERWIARHGRPLALYTDWATHFRQTPKSGQLQGPTQIERALRQLGIRLICAHSPQAKGRVERSHGTDQDRLVKGLRLAGASTLAAANRFLEEEYLPRINAKFAVAPADPADAHRWAQGYDLAAILCVQEPRTVGNDWTVSIDARAWQIEPGERTAALRGCRVTLERRRDGQLALRWGDRYLKFHRVPGALEQRLGREQRPSQRAVDLPPCGQPDSGTQNAPGRARLPTGLEQPATQPPGQHPGAVPVVHKLHSPDDEDRDLEKLIEEIKTPVRIVSHAHKPAPNHPWVKRHF